MPSCKITSVTHSFPFIYIPLQRLFYADIRSKTTTGSYSTTVSPTPVPSKELVLPPKDYFGPTDCYDFPNDFVFGVAGSAAQIEGAVALEGRTPTLQEILVTGDKPKNYVTNENYFLYKQDIERLAAMGVEYYSFTIPWSRILPFVLPGTPVNKQAIDHYNDLIDTVLDAGMKPIVTMLHFDSPLMFVANDNISMCPSTIVYLNILLNKKKPATQRSDIIMAAIKMKLLWMR